MPTLTSFTSIIVLAVFMFGCATQEIKPDKLSQLDIDKAVKQTTESDIQKYRDAIALLNSGNLKNAREKLTEFTEERPELAGPWANLGLISIKENKLGDAESLLQKALARNSDMPQALNLMGYIEKHRAI